MKHYYIDTNVIIDMLADRGEFAEAASNLLMLRDVVRFVFIYRLCHIQIFII